MPAILYIIAGICVGIPVCGIIHTFFGTRNILKKLRHAMMMLR